MDYTHSYSPRIVSASIKLPLYHFDVAQAYIRASLDEEVYMKLPGGCGEMLKTTAKLERVIYDLKQSGRTWGHFVCWYFDGGWF